jgi:hypothetical protein
MAAFAGALLGQGPVALNDTAVAALKLGTPASAVLTAATASTLTIPVGYAAVVVSVASAAWFNFSSDSTAATPAGANCFLVTPGEYLIAAVPTGATKMSFIFDSNTAVGGVCVTGIF